MFTKKGVRHLGITMADAINNCQSPDEAQGVLNAYHLLGDLLHNKQGFEFYCEFAKSFELSVDPRLKERPSLPH